MYVPKVTISVVLGLVVDRDTQVMFEEEGNRLLTLLQRIRTKSTPIRVEIGVNVGHIERGWRFIDAFVAQKNECIMVLPSDVVYKWLDRRFRGILGTVKHLIQEEGDIRLAVYLIYMINVIITGMFHSSICLCAVYMYVFE